MRKIVLYGAGAMARTIAKELGDLCAGVVADTGKGQIGRHIVRSAANLLALFPPTQYDMLLAIGYQHGLMNARRAELFTTMRSAGYIFSTLGCEDIGDGAVMLRGSVVHANANIRENVFIGSNVTVGHDVRINSHAWINSGVSIDGGAVIGERCVIGANAVIGAGVMLGARTLVGPGCVILRDTEPNSAYIHAHATKQRFSSDVFGSVIKT